MKVFQCQSCGQLLYFENTRCERCERSLGYLPEACSLTALEPLGDGSWTALAAPRGGAVRYCGNQLYQACNWLLPADSPDLLCLACRLNRTIPDINDPVQLGLWRSIEEVKRRLVYSVLRLGLPLVSKREDPAHGLAFDFLADASHGSNEQSRVTTGHANGLITIDTAEADPAERERRRVTLAEPYRTLPGHLRHEVGHYYWGRLFETEDERETFRGVFGDERADYGQALQAYYANGPAPDWRERFVSAYASAHPWEDWAETWAHYLHILDTMETAAAFGLAPGAFSGRRSELAVDDPFRAGVSFDALIETWLPLTYAVNSLNRGMGQPDLYPFVLSASAIDKLRFVHSWIEQRHPRSQSPAGC